jgi:hypothetical protein
MSVELQGDATDWAWQAFSAARLRFGPHPTIPGVYATLGEAVYWAMVLDEQKWTDVDYEAALAASPALELVLGFRYVRNLTTHKLPVHLKRHVEGGMIQPIPALFGGQVLFRWLPFEDLPLLAERHRKSSYGVAQADAYRSRFAGQDAMVTLGELGIWLARWFEPKGRPSGGDGRLEG